MVMQGRRNVQRVELKHQVDVSDMGITQCLDTYGVYNECVVAADFDRWRTT